MNPLNMLGLDADVDTRSIKRRYAQLLKQHRPDEDPEAFQRLREAYEQALQLAAARHDAEPDEAPSALFHERGEQQSSVSNEPTPLVAAQATADVHTRIAQLLESSPSLDEALQHAREQALEADFQRYLLARCAAFDEHGLSTLRWGMQHLHWLSPWQADYLPGAHLDGLARRLLKLELEQLQQRLQAGEERAVLERVAALVASDWLQPFDRRLQLQDGLVWMLEETEHWSGALLERLCRLFGWSDDTGELPCSRERWDGLCWRCERHAVWQRLLQHLQEAWPLRAEQRATWLLLKPLAEREARRLVDHFDEDDWQACDALDEVLSVRYPELPGLLGLQRDTRWQRWQPRKWMAPATVYVWMLLFAAMYGTSLQEAQLPFYLERSGGFLALAFKDLLISAGVVAWLAMIARGWSRLALYLTRLDVPLSQFILPSAWCDRGAGMLILRHGIPAALFAAIVAGFAPTQVPSWATFGGAFALQIVFLGLVGSRRSPWPRWSMLHSVAFKVDYSKKAEW